MEKKRKVWGKEGLQMSGNSYITYWKLKGES